MSRSKGKNGKEGRSMTRGEFLAAGAAVGLGGVVGAVGEGGNAGGSGMCPPPQSCRPVGDISDVGETWAIPGGVLNAFWSEVLPRLAARAWWDTATIPNGDLMGWLNSAPPDPIQKLLARMGEFQPAPDPLPVPLPNPIPWNWLTHQAAAKFNLVEEYLTQGSPGSRIPIRFVVEGGYDFLLSDKGLDVFIPPRPLSSFELIRYFTFRGTGKRPIGTPVFMSKPHLAVSTDSPTGPGQIVTEPLTVLIMLLEDVVAAAGGPEVLSTPACEVKIDCPARGIGYDPSGMGHGRWRKMWNKYKEGDQGGERFTDSWEDPEWEAWESFVSFLEKPGGLTTTPRKIKCLVAGFRHWQIEGSVYRGMMVEFPRIVAELWLEQEMGVGPGSSPDVWQKSYTRRLTQPANVNADERVVFEERLEAMLPKTKQMYLQAKGVGGVEPPAGHVWKDRWNPDDVMVTNKGIFFPEIPDLTALGGNSDARLDEVFKEIAAGRAGNPVFTDSSRTEGDGEW